MNYDVSKWNKLIQLDDFKWVLKSILDIGDEKSEWKADFIDFVNSETSDAQSSFYYDMLPYVRFTDEGRDVGAYTTPDHLIWMNAPHGFGIGEQDYKWEFIYCHECLHQLWDTFGVEDNIKKQFGDCDREVLNIASDCVINDFLNVNKKMPYPVEGLVTPEYLRDKYGVEYDRKQDTQFSLYEKLIKVADKIKQDRNANNQPNQDADGKKHQNGQGGGGGNGNQQQQGGNQQQGNGGGNGNQQQQGGGNGGNQSGNQSGNQQGGGNSGTGNNQGQGTGSGTKGYGKDNSTTPTNNKGKGGGGGNLDKFTGWKPFGPEPSSDYFKKSAEKTIQKYAGKLTGAIGEFVRKCRTSKSEERHEGMVTRQRKGAAWNKQLDKMMDTYIQQQVYDKHREFELTYHRFKRGSRPVQFGDIIKKGKKIKDDKLNITMSFYIDCSGSMDHDYDNSGDCTEKCFQVANEIAEKIIKGYKDDSVVGDVGCKFFAFDDGITEVEPKKKYKAGNGGTMSMDKLIDIIKKRTSGDLVNIVLSDTEMSIDKTQVINLVKNMEGMVFWIANQPKPECEELQKMLKGKFVFLQTDTNFTIA